MCLFLDLLLSERNHLAPKGERLLGAQKSFADSPGGQEPKSRLLRPSRQTSDNETNNDRHNARGIESLETFRGILLGCHLKVFALLHDLVF